jgi:hypothetical protein
VDAVFPTNGDTGDYFTADVTANYLQNPSYETDDITQFSATTNSADGLRGYAVSQPASWTRTGSEVVSLLVTPQCYTDNNFGLVTNMADGQQAYYLRMGWNTGSTVLTSKTQQLPKGKYRLSVDYRSAYANSAVSSFTLTAAGVSSSKQNFDAGSTGVFTSMPWSTQTVEFELTKAQTVDISLGIDWLSGGSCIMFDNLRLFQWEEPVPDAIEGVKNEESEMMNEELKTKDRTGIFDLTGRRVANTDQLPSGIYLVGGRKMFVR